MQDELPFPEVEVAVVVIVHDHRLMAVYNPQWGAFTLPMTKRRNWDDKRVPAAHRQENWPDAAARAAAEWLGRTVTGLTPYTADIPPYQQSDRDGDWKRYHFQTFELSLTTAPETLPAAIVEWLSLQEFLDEERRPISPTARHVLRHLQAEATGAGSAFP